MNEPILQATNVGKTFNTGLWRKRPMTAVRGVDFQLHPGRCLAVVGESGSGKSTLARLATGLIRPSFGQLRLMDRDMADPELCANLPGIVQMVFQDPTGCLNPRLKIRDLLLEPFRLQGLLNGNARHLLNQSLELAMLSRDMLDRRPHQLSGGQRQRLALVRALVLEPRVLVADEPAASLDRSIQASLLAGLNQRKRQNNLAILLISHDIRMVKLLADHVAVMYLGKLVEQGPATEVLANPLHPYTRALLNSVPGHNAGQTRQGLRGEPPSPLNPPTGCAFHPRCPQAQPKCRTTPPPTHATPPTHTTCCHQRTIE